jgi:hypothetical protein
MDIKRSFRIGTAVIRHGIEPGESRLKGWELPKMTALCSRDVKAAASPRQ